MESRLRVLIVEDSHDDAELMALALTRGGLDPAWERVETADGLRAALAAGPWDAVLADFTVPGFGAAAALAVVRAADPDIPFVVVSGTIGEDVAVGMMRAGASDYVLKHSLVRLAPAVEREVREAGNRRARRAAERAAADAARQGDRDRREAEVLLFQAQKLESLGVLAGGIAHDLNNILTPILGYAELAADALPEHSPAAPLLEEVGRNARRAADLVGQILAYAGKGRFVIEPVDLSGLVRDMGGLLASAVSTRAGLVYDLAEALPAVEADATQLRQVVLNLVTNAAEAAGEGGGTVTVRTGLVRPDVGRPESPRPEAGPSGPAVLLEVADYGCGMTADLIGKIFDPFFTTKFTGRGLGLAAVQGIARGHGGALHVRSEPGRGSTFRLVLPGSTGTVTAAAPGRAADWRGAGTVLVADDEGAVRALAARVLERAGMTVLVAGDGREAVEVFREHRARVDAVLLDLTMSRMGGLEAAAAMRALRPDLPVVLMSGFSVSDVTLRSAGLGIAGFVQKPFATPDLLAAVRYALGR